MATAEPLPILIEYEPASEGFIEIREVGSGNRVPLRERLPAIRVPLRETDDDAPLDLQAIVEQAYRNGRYDTLDYKADPNPPLRPADAAWAGELLQARIAYNK